MRKSYKPIAAVITTHTTLSYTSKRKAGIGKMPEGMIDSTSSKGYFPEHFFPDDLIMSEEIEC